MNRRGSYKCNGAKLDKHKDSSSVVKLYAYKMGCAKRIGFPFYKKKKRKISIPKTFVLYDTIWWLSCKITFCYSVSATRIENVMIRRPPYFSSSTTFVSNPLSVNEVCCQWKLNESYLESMLGKFECEMHSSLTNSNLLTFDRLLTVLQTGSVIHWKITFFLHF